MFYQNNNLISVPVQPSPLRIAFKENEITIQRSESFNFHKGVYGDYLSENAYDGDFDTYYVPKTGQLVGNFLKLYLSRAYSITKVQITSRKGNTRYVGYIKGTEVSIYSTKNGETKVSSCGTITGK